MNFKSIVSKYHRLRQAQDMNSHRINCQQIYESMCCNPYSNNSEKSKILEKIFNKKRAMNLNATLKFFVTRTINSQWVFIVKFSTNIENFFVGQSTYDKTLAKWEVKNSTSSNELLTQITGLMHVFKVYKILV